MYIYIYIYAEESCSLNCLKESKRHRDMGTISSNYLKLGSNFACYVWFNNVIEKRNSKTL